MSDTMPAPDTAAARGRREWRWWACVASLWGLATAWDRLWLARDGRIPSWDQADYLNSAVDHGRALGLLSGSWQGWAALLDHSPKIPPLASLVNGSVMALAGDSPDAASWSLALWHGLLLAVVAAWGRQLGGRRVALLCVALVALAPALMALRVDYTLDIPLTATTTLALWLLGRWQAASPGGGHGRQALLAALAIGAALLVKQSALLLVALPALWAAVGGLRRRERRLQVLLALAVVVALVLPWLHHNWITTLGGTNRAVIESASSEGDPPVLSTASLLWYARLLPQQLGLPLLLPGLLGLVLGLGHRLSPDLAWLDAAGAPRPPAPPPTGSPSESPAATPRPSALALPPGWGWLLGCAAAGWLATTLSPNKDARYIAPVLPLLLMVVAAGWWQLGRWLCARLGSRTGAVLVGAGLVAGAGSSAAGALATLLPSEPNPLPALVGRLRSEVKDAPTTLLVVPGSPSLNEQNVTTYGRMAGGRIEGRRLGRRRSEHPLVLERAEWLLLASGDQGTNRPGSRELSLRLRADGRFEPVGRWPWSEGRQVELWRRRGQVAPPFDRDFIRLARGLEQGPGGLAAVFQRIGPEHQLDGHFLYQQRVRRWALARLQRNPDDRDALWSLALLATLNNRPVEAGRWYGRLQDLEPGNPWPAAYRAVVSLADWNPGGAAQALERLPDDLRRQPIPRSLADLSAVLSGRLWRIPPLAGDLPAAIEAVKSELKPAAGDGRPGGPS
jgi:4-amino-4-deoxy-L-arabinose transferase-like glycosyltransferase